MQLEASWNFKIADATSGSFCLSFLPRTISERVPLLTPLILDFQLPELLDNTFLL